MYSTIKVNGLYDAVAENKIKRILSPIKGIEMLVVDPEEATVQLEYDFRKIVLEKIEDKIRSLGFTLPSGYCDIDSGQFIEKMEVN